MSGGRSAAFKEIKLKKGWVGKEDFSDKGWIGVTWTDVFEELNEKWFKKIEDEMKKETKGGNGSGGKKSSINKMTITHPEASGHGKQALLKGWGASRGIRGFSSLKKRRKITGVTFQLT